jgi:hypothetical protein
VVSLPSGKAAVEVDGTCSMVAAEVAMVHWLVVDTT